MGKNNEYLNCFRIVVFLMKLFGVFPFVSLHIGHFSSSGNKIEKTWIFSSKALTISSVLLYFAVLYNQLYHQYQQIENVIKYSNIILFVCVLPIVTFRIAMLVIPMIMWRRSRHLHLHWDNWMNFQIQVEKLTGIPFQSSMKSIVLGVNLVGMTCICAGAMMLNRKHELCLAVPPNNLAVLYLSVVLCSIILYWYTNNLYAKQAAKKIQDLVQESLRSNKSADLRRIVDLWMELCNLSKGFNEIHANLFLFMFSIAGMVLVAYIYLAIILLINNPDTLVGLSYLYVSWFNILVVVLFCEPANAFSYHINSKMKEVLLKNDSMNMKITLKRMIILFLQTIEIRNPKVTLYEYITVDRSTVPMIFGTVINYLIILKQFVQTEMGNNEEIISYSNGNKTEIVNV